MTAGSADLCACGGIIPDVSSTSLYVIVAHVRIGRRRAGFRSYPTHSLLVFLYGDVPDASEFLRTARALWLEIKSDNVAETRQRIIESGLARTLELPDPHLYFQAPGGQCLRLVGIDQDLSFYEGVGEGPDVSKVKAAFKREATTI